MAVFQSLVVTFLFVTAAHAGPAVPEEIPGADSNIVNDVLDYCDKNTVESSTVHSNVDGKAEPNVSSVSGGRLSDRDRLLRHLFQEIEYNKKNYPDDANLKFNFALLRLDVNEASDVWQIDSYLRMQWDDERLRWDPALYGNVTVLRVDSHDIWKPDLTLYNSDGIPGTSKCSSPYSLLYSSGKVIHVPACHEQPYCEKSSSMAYWGPNVEYTCVLKYGSWTFDGKTMDLQFYDKPEADVSNLSGGRWKISGNSAKRVEKFYDCCVEPYITLEFELKVKRKIAMNTTMGWTVRDSLFGAVPAVLPPQT